MGRPKQPPEVKIGEFDPAAGGKNAGGQQAGEPDGVDQPGVEALGDLRLQAGLFVEADLEVGQQEKLRPHFSVQLEQRLVVVAERPAQIDLAIGRISRAKLLAEAGDGFIIRNRVREAVGVKASELAADLLEDLLIPTADRIAGPIDGRREVVSAQGQFLELSTLAALVKPAEAAKLSAACTVDGERLRRISSKRARSSLRIVWPACLEAQVAKVHQFAARPVRPAKTAESSW